MNITVIGTGYVGTVTGACLADMGHQVIGTDLNEKRINTLAQGTVPFFEPGLQAMLQANLKEGRLSFTSDICQAIAQSEVIFLCIGTQTLPDGSPDSKPLHKAIEDIAHGMCSSGGYKLLIEKTTMPVKTGEWLIALLEKNIAKVAASTQPSFDVAAVPQFMREGYAVYDFMHPDRIVVGTHSQKALQLVLDIYKPMNAPVLVTDINSAELIKHATNALLATKVSFINTIAHLCEKTGADVHLVAKGLGLDRRISDQYLSAGLGYGGVFFSKDIASLVKIADEYHVNLDLIKSTETVNRYQRLRFIDRIAAAALGKKECKNEERLDGKTIALWGLAYRPNTDDMRDAPSLTIISGLQKRGAKICAYDPLANEATRVLHPKVSYFDDPYACAKDADVIAVLTDWDEFAHISMAHLKEVSRCRTIVDGRNLYSPERMKVLGMHYMSIGRSAVDGRNEQEKQACTATPSHNSSSCQLDPATASDRLYSPHPVDTVAKRR